MPPESNVWPRTQVTGVFSATGDITLAAAPGANKVIVLKKLIVSCDATASALQFKLVHNSVDILELQSMVGPDKWSEDLELRCTVTNTALILNIATMAAGAGSYYAEYEVR